MYGGRGARASFAPSAPPYAPPPPPGAPALEPCRRCGAALPPRSPDGRADLLRAAHFAGQCGAPARPLPPPPPLPPSHAYPGFGYGRYGRAPPAPPPAHVPMPTSGSSLPSYAPFLGARAPPFAPPGAARGAGASSSGGAGVATVGPPAPAMAVYAATEKDCVTADGEPNECVICLEEFAVGDELGLLECFCKFHRRCIVEWYEKGSGVCPTHKVIGGGGLD